MAKINMASIRVKVAEGYGQKVVEDAAKKRAQAVFDDAVIGMQKDFEDHPVTQELDGGISAANISQTLRGGDGPENLYSFIGFPNGEQPTQEIRQRLDPENPDGPKLKYIGRTARADLGYKFEISAPNAKEIYAATPIPWAKGMSWAQKIEKGIPGFAKFIARFMGEPSRSGGGIQTPNDVRSATYVPPANGYLSTIFANFINRVKTYGKSGYKPRFKK